MPNVHLPGIQTIVFDLDDTLLAEREFAFSGFAAVANWLEGRLACPFDALVRMRELFETESRHRVFNQLLAETGCPDAEKLVPAMIDCYRQHRPQIRMLPDAARALERWHGRFLALISDGPLEMQRRKVEALGLGDRLDLVVLTDEWGQAFWKPNPRAFEFVEARSCHQGIACVYIADNPAKDFVAPNGLGWHTIQVQREGGIYVGASPVADGRPEFQVRSLDEVDIS